MNGPIVSSLRFGRYELDPARFELRADGVPVRLEPRVLEVLLYLATHRDRVVPKEELIDQLWEKRFVSESALTRCIAAARRAVEGEGEVIRTVHGRGYRFVANASSATPADAAGDSPEAGTPSEPAMTDPVSAPVAIGAPQYGAEPPSRRSGVRWLSWLVVTSTILIVAATTMLLVKPARNVDPAIVHLALLPLSTEDPSDADLELMAISINDVLERRLSSVPRLSVLPARYGAPLSLEASSLAAFTEKAGVNAVVTGHLRRTVGGDKAQVTISLHQRQSDGKILSTPIGRFDVPFLRARSDAAGFTRVRDQIAAQVISRLTPTIAIEGGSMPVRDPDAYRLYLLGQERLGKGTCDESALSLLQRSLELDEEYAPAWEQYGWAQYGMVSSCARDVSHYERALEAANRALLLSPGMTSAVGLRTVVLVETGRAEEAWQTLLDAGRPDSPDIQSFSFYVLGYAGYLDEARTWLTRLHQTDPTYLTTRGWTPNVLLYLKDYDGFLSALPATESPVFRFYRALAELSRGRRTEAAKVAAPAFRLNPHDIFARLSQALLACVQGRSADARAALHHLALQRSELGAMDGEMTYKIAQLYVESGDHAAALEQLRIAVGQGFFCAPCFERDPLLEPLRPSPEFTELVRTARSRHEAFGTRFRLRQR